MNAFWASDHLTGRYSNAQIDWSRYGRIADGSRVSDEKGASRY
jgi:hypothetical protein